MDSSFLWYRSARTARLVTYSLVGIGLALRTLCATGATTAAPPQPAAWIQHMVQVQLHDMPKDYSCYDLWYRFREVLERIGARPDWKITTQGCVFSGKTQARSPQVELQFYFPEALTPAQARYADLNAVQSTVVLAPSTAAHSLDRSDCVLVKQITDALLPALPVKVLEAHVDCSGSPGQPYRVVVQTLLPTPAAQPAAGGSAPAHR